jgi:NAD(P)-dependent dehydrogenase (short-subunit alcohol dehydrogenase family)
MHKAVIMGVGPDRGLGAQLCKRFAKEGLHVVAAGRAPASLDAVVADIERSGGEASSFVSDATKEADVAAVFEHAGSDVDLAIYNAGNNTPGRVLEMEADYFEKSWRVACYGGFLFGREALRRPAEARRHPVHRGERLAARSGRVRRLQFSQGRPAYPRPGDGEGMRPRGHPCRPRRRRRRKDTQALPGRRLAPRPDDRYRGYRRVLRLPLSTAAQSLVLRGRRAHVPGKLVSSIAVAKGPLAHQTLSEAKLHFRP